MQSHGHCTIGVFCLDDRGVGVLSLLSAVVCWCCAQVVDSVDEFSDQAELVAGVGEGDAGELAVVFLDVVGAFCGDLAFLDEDGELVVECVDGFFAERSAQADDQIVAHVA